MIKKTMRCALYILCGIIVSGCASTHQGPSSISQTFHSEIKRDLGVAQVIDCRPEKGDIRDIKELSNYRSFYEDGIVWSVNNRGFLSKEMTVDVKDCQCFKNVESGATLDCLKFDATPPASVALLICVDEYVPPGSLSMTATVGVTGILYDHASKKVLWRNSIRQESGNEVLMFGLGGYVGGLIARSMQSAETPYRDGAFMAIRALLKTLPECPESTCSASASLQ
jgi:hypothetical protein